MHLRFIFAAATLLTAVPALANGGADTDSIARAEKHALKRCTMRELHIPAGRGLGSSAINCTQVARDEVAATRRNQALANRDTTSAAGRD